MVGVLILAGVIVVGSALSEPQATQAPDTNLAATTDAATEADLLYGRAQLALQSGDTTAAIALLEQVVAADPTNQQAVQTLQVARTTQSNAAASSSGGASSSSSQKPKPAAPKADDPAFSKPTDDLGVLLPPSAEGYSLGQKVVVDDDATVSGTPNGPDLIGSRALWAVHYRKSNKDALTFVNKVSKSLYAKNPKTLKVDGSTAYFGTDGTRFATVVYVRGRYVFEVVLTTLDGKPSSLSNEAEKAAKAFPDTL